jgi:hypothetical protein
MRVPVSANIAFAIAGATGGTIDADIRFRQGCGAPRDSVVVSPRLALRNRRFGALTHTARLHQLPLRACR